MEIWQVTGFYSPGSLLYDSSGPFNCGFFLLRENAEDHIKKLEEQYGPYERGSTPFSSKGYSFHIQGPYFIVDWKDNELIR